jgi:hypothetical protein
MEVNLFSQNLDGIDKALKLFKLKGESLVFGFCNFTPRFSSSAAASS